MEIEKSASDLLSSMIKITGRSYADLKENGLFVITEPAWVQMCSGAFPGISDPRIGADRRRLLGIPVRLTFDDAGDIPNIVLYVKPIFHQTKEGIEIR